MTVSRDVPVSVGRRDVKKYGCVSVRPSSLTYSPLVPPPIIVCGPPRSGTTTTRRLLDAHPKISITSEFPLQELKPIEQLLKKLGKQIQGKNFRRRRGQIMQTIWWAASKEKPSLDAPMLGNKTPWSEMHARFYEWVFAADPPKWLYVLRDPRATFKSVLNMPWSTWDTDVGRLLDRYKKSLKAMEDLKTQRADSIFVFQIDKLDDVEDRKSRCDELFAFLGLNPSPATQAFVEEWPSVNSTATKDVAQRFPELPADLVELMENDQELWSLLKPWGYQA